MFAEKMNVATKVEYEMDFELIETDKLGGNWEQEFAVVRKKVVYLRIVGDGTHYRVMTATSGEDFGGYRICLEKQRLWEAAAQLAREYNCAETSSEDKKRRVYIQLFTVSQDKNDSDEVFTKDLEELVENFFAIYDSLDA